MLVTRIEPTRANVHSFARWPVFTIGYTSTGTLASLYDDETRVCSANVLRTTARVDGETISVCGIGGVYTPPSLRRKGYASQLMRDIEADAGTVVGVLFCFDALIPFYVRLGWHQAVGPVTYRQPDDPCRVPVPGGINVLVKGRAIIAQALDIDSLPW